MLLSDLPDGARAVVTAMVAPPLLGAAAGSGAVVDAATLRRLGELGFIAGESVQLMRRGPGGREPLAVMVGQTLFALRAVEAQCIEVAAD